MSSILDFILQNWVFLLILIVSLVAILSLYYVFTLRAGERLRKPEEQPQSNNTVAQTAFDEQPIVQPVEPIVVGGEIVTHPIRHVEPTPVEEAPPSVPVPPASSPVEQKPEAVVEPAKPKPKKTLGRYHVLYRSADDSWIVKREGSDRILRVLETQKDAIAFATIKALSNDTQIVIHKKDGKIRKQNYRKSDEE